jgi:hypothetical protein
MHANHREERARSAPATSPRGRLKSTTTGDTLAVGAIVLESMTSRTR